MPYGMHVYDETGKLINDTNDRFPRMMGSFVTTAGVAGQLAISIPANTDLIFFTRNQSNLTSCELPKFTVTNTLIKWQYGNYDPNFQHVPYADCLVMWGYF